MSELHITTSISQSPPGAALVVSRDRDLLDLMDPTKPEAAAFQNLYRSLRILDPVAFLREVDAA